ncbi:hypothetical protein RF11_02670 [Thelohanellus kitauei]|uniref:Uncharacterized protein n=1 Tax=Thelohanellus kitauei TaxID=669202 RepID=A0A0C2MMP4_THEKT|nr:hypothetical protein RF11_02670 [Thelohanellus kitauei]
MEDQVNLAAIWKYKNISNTNHLPHTIIKKDIYLMKMYKTISDERSNHLRNIYQKKLVYIVHINKFVSKNSENIEQINQDVDVQTEELPKECETSSEKLII